jgi:hypothetical protein
MFPDKLTVAQVLRSSKNLIEPERSVFSIPDSTI